MPHPHQRPQHTTAGRLLVRHLPHPHPAHLSGARELPTTRSTHTHAQSCPRTCSPPPQSHPWRDPQQQARLNVVETGTTFPASQALPPTHAPQLAHRPTLDADGGAGTGLTWGVRPLAPSAATAAAASPPSLATPPQQPGAPSPRTPLSPSTQGRPSPHCQLPFQRKINPASHEPPPPCLARPQPPTTHCCLHHFHQDQQY